MPENATVQPGPRGADVWGMWGEGSVVRRLWGRVVVGTVTLVCVVAVTPANASPQGRLAAAQETLDALAGQIHDRAVALSQARDALAEADRRTTVATTRLAILQSVRERLDAEVARSAARLLDLQTRLNDVATEAFMGAGSGSDASVLGSVLHAGSFGEFGDRLTYADAAGSDLAGAAQVLVIARADLDAKRAALGVMIGGQRAIVAEITDAGDQAAAAVAAEQAAIAALDESRDRALGLVRRLQSRPAGLPGLDLGSIARALQGADAVPYGRWADLFLRVVGAPTCRNNRVAVISWQVAESTQAAWNPLATTHRMSGSTDFNTVGVQNYPSLVRGLEATRDTIEFGWDVYGYGAIVTSLRGCAPAIETARAINASSWCRGCVGGQYVVNIVPRVDADLAAYREL